MEEEIGKYCHMFREDRGSRRKNCRRQDKDK